MSDVRETVNARIASTMLGVEDHGIMTFFLFLEWNGGGQGLGGFALDHNGGSKGWGAGIIAIRKILEVVGVEKWEDLKGKLVRAKIDGPGSARPPIIGNIIEDQWFDLKTFAEENQ